MFASFAACVEYFFLNRLPSRSKPFILRFLVFLQCLSKICFYFYHPIICYLYFFRPDISHIGKPLFIQYFATTSSARSLFAPGGDGLCQWQRSHHRSDEVDERSWPLCVGVSGHGMGTCSALKFLPSAPNFPIGR